MVYLSLLCSTFPHSAMLRGESVFEGRLCLLHCYHPPVPHYVQNHLPQGRLRACGPWEMQNCANWVLAVKFSGGA